MEIEIAVNLGATIGEAPTWIPGANCLYWIDVRKPALYRFDPATGSNRAWAMPADIGAFALLEDLTGAVVALRTGLYRLDFATDGLTQLLPAPFDPQLFRFNEGACDLNGRFWVGVMFDPLQHGLAARDSSLHIFTLSDGLRREPDAAELHNGMAWSPDNTTFYLTHTQRREIFAHPFDAATSRIGSRRLFARLSDETSKPDGAAVDVEGAYWCALYGAGRLRRYTPAGIIDREVLLPVSQPTMCAFGGPALDTLYVTSAAENLNAAERAREPLAGALLRFQPGVTGIPRHYAVK